MLYILYLTLILMFAGSIQESILFIVFNLLPAMDVAVGLAVEGVQTTHTKKQTLKLC